MGKDVKTFRFDDVCTNANMELIQEITEYLFDKFEGCKVIWGVSPLVSDGCGERVFPEIWNAYSDYKKFYRVDKCGMIDVFHHRVEIASHGLIHVDHRLLTKEAQEMSILVSSSLVGARKFIPPFNKWNRDTELICLHNGIELIKFEDGWKSMEYNKFSECENLWYLHAREWTIEKIKEYFK